MPWLDLIARFEVDASSEVGKAPDTETLIEFIPYDYKVVSRYYQQITEKIKNLYYVYFKSSEVDEYYTDTLCNIKFYLIRDGRYADVDGKMEEIPYFTRSVIYLDIMDRYSEFQDGIEFKDKLFKLFKDSDLNLYRKELKIKSSEMPYFYYESDSGNYFLGNAIPLDEHHEWLEKNPQYNSVKVFKL